MAVKTDIRISVCQMSIFRDRKTAVKEVKDWLPRLHCIVVGPGMGRNPTIIENVKVSPWWVSKQVESCKLQVFGTVAFLFDLIKKDCTRFPSTDN